MPSKDFVHLHLHTEYSLLDGFARINEIVPYAKELGMNHLAISDHGTMFGVIDFYRKCKEAAINPVIGVEAYLAPRRHTDRDSKLDNKPFHLLLLAKNNVGYQNLLRLSSIAQIDGYYYRPRIDKELLERYSEGVIATSGCLAAEIPRYFEQGEEEKALDALDWYRQVFGDDFYLELQWHGIPELDRLNPWLIEVAKQTGTPLVATNDVHYVRPEDFDPHDTLLSIQTGSLKSETDRMKMTGNTYYLRDQAEMWSFFEDTPEAFYNTLRIAEQCEVDLETEGYHLPVFPVPPTFAHAGEYLRYLCEKGLRWRYGDDAPYQPKYADRLDFELNVIHEMGFDTYFLIVWDLCQFARYADIWWNVRGSGAGSVVAYTLGITNLDPLENGLLFERFLNPGRVSMPDFDIDYPEDQRMRMIEYCVRKYGEDKVAAIITFGTMGAKGAIRDVGRALGAELSEVDAITRTIPTAAKLPSIKQMIGDDPDYVNVDLKAMYDNDRQGTIREIIDTAKLVEGAPRHVSTHAAGIIVADKPLVEYIPLHRPTKGDSEDSPVKLVTQFPMETAESIGLLKIDFLGLSTLTILRRACRLIEQYHGISYDMSNIPYKPDPHNPEVTRQVEQMFEMIGAGHTAGVFQVESSGMRQMLRDMRPQTFEHIVAAISLYRPGPMDYIPTFNRRMHGDEIPEYHHEKLIPILENTYGIMVYQEQLMQIGAELFGYSLAEADLMRRAVSKKKQADLQKHRAIFLERGPENGIPKEAAGKIFDDIEFFANYGFNKCVVGDTLIVDAESGAQVRVEDLYTGRVQVQKTLALNTETLRLEARKIEAVMANGVKPTYRLKTAAGRSIEATANHPFYTFEGWRLLEELEIGQHIATARTIPLEGQLSEVWPRHKLIVLGHLLAEGNLCHPYGLYFYTSDEQQWQDYVTNLEQFENTLASTHQRRGMYEVYSKRCNSQELTEVVAWIEQLGLRFQDSYTKFIPDEVFKLPKDAIALLIARMWEGDGHINLLGRSLYYATSSHRMATQLQHLLLRFGITARLRRVNFPYKDGRIGYQLFITGNEQIAIFSAEIGCHFISLERKQKLAQLVLESPSIKRNKDVIPLGIRDVVRAEKEKLGKTWGVIQQETQLSITTFNRTVTGAKIGYTRDVIGVLGDYFNSEALKAQANSDIHWDSIVSIEYVGEQATYDLTIEEHHNFVANDIIVHNSHAADYAVITCQTAYLKCHYPHEYMAALMSVYFDDSAKVSQFVMDCQRMEIDVLPPDVNHSEADFIITEQADGSRAIRFGLGAIKNLGGLAIQYIINQRGDEPFKDLDDFLKRCLMKDVGKRGLEALIRVDALAGFGYDRTLLLANLERLMAYSLDQYKQAASGQKSLFDLMEGEAAAAGSVGAVLVESPPREWDFREQLRWEKDLIGVYMSAHPLKGVWRRVEQVISNEIGELKAEPEAFKGKVVRVAALITEVKRLFTRRDNKPMGSIMFEDMTGSISGVIFHQEWVQLESKIAVDKILVLKGEVDLRDSGVQIKVFEILKEYLVTGPEESPREIWSADAAQMADEPRQQQRSASRPINQNGSKSLGHQPKQRDDRKPAPNRGDKAKPTYNGSGRGVELDSPIGQDGQDDGPYETPVEAASTTSDLSALGSEDVPPANPMNQVNLDHRAEDRRYTLDAQTYAKLRRYASHIIAGDKFSPLHKIRVKKPNFSYEDVPQIATGLVGSNNAYEEQVLAKRNLEANKHQLLVILLLHPSIDVLYQDANLTQMIQLALAYPGLDVLMICQQQMNGELAFIKGGKEGIELTPELQQIFIASGLVQEIILKPMEWDSL